MILLLYIYIEREREGEATMASVSLTNLPAIIFDVVGMCFHARDL